MTAAAPRAVILVGWLESLHLFALVACVCVCVEYIRRSDGLLWCARQAKCNIAIRLSRDALVDVCHGENGGGIKKTYRVYKYYYCYYYYTTTHMSLCQ